MHGWFVILFQQNILQSNQKFFLIFLYHQFRIYLKIVICNYWGVLHPPPTPPVGTALKTTLYSKTAKPSKVMSSPLYESVLLITKGDHDQDMDPLPYLCFFAAGKSFKNIPMRFSLSDALFKHNREHIFLQKFNQN